MREAVIVSTARTGLAKSWRGALNMTHGATMGGHVVRAAIERAGIEPGEVEDVLMGCATPQGATGSNIARQIALAAGCPVTVSGVTVNRFCSSGLQTIAMAAQRIIAGEGEVYVAGGVESISCVQNEANRHMIMDKGLKRAKPEVYWSMLQTAEMVAKRYNIARERQDEYGVQSEQRACAAAAAGRFTAQVVPITVRLEAAGRRDGPEALQHRARAPGRTRRAEPAARLRGRRRGQGHRRDRTDHRAHGGGGQGHRPARDPRGHAVRRRGAARGHDAG